MKTYFESLRSQLENMMILQGQLLGLKNKSRAPLANLHEAEFKVFSQYGEDGILQYLISQVDLKDEEKVFVEFGVQNYCEANTRFLLQAENWRGLVIDCNNKFMDEVRRSDLYWRNDLTAVTAWIDRDNINDLIGNAGYHGSIGLLSIDIDGNDYWVWQAIEVIQPVIVVVEWNSVFGRTHAVSIPYQKDFDRSTAHYSCLYWGASMQAFEHLGRKKGYILLGSNRVGNNLFLVRSDRARHLKALSTQEAYVIASFRDSRDRKGELNFLSGERRYEEIKNLRVVDIITGKETTLLELENCTERGGVSGF